MSRLSPWPVVAVGALIWQADRLLLIRRGQPPRQGQWSIPGGRQEAGETVEQAVKREILEETGLEITILGVAAVVDLIDRDGETLHSHYTVIDMLAEWQAGDPVAGSDALEAAWFSAAEWQALGLPPLQLEVIEQARRKREEHRQ